MTWKIVLISFNKTSSLATLLLKFSSRIIIHTKSCVAPISRTMQLVPPLESQAGNTRSRYQISAGSPLVAKSNLQRPDSSVESLVAKSNSLRMDSKLRTYGGISQAISRQKSRSQPHSNRVTRSGRHKSGNLLTHQWEKKNIHFKKTAKKLSLKKKKKWPESWV